MSLDKLSILNGLSHVLGNYKYGHQRTDDSEEEKKVGLQRDAGHPILSNRPNDGFSLKFEGEHLCLYYHFDGLDVKDFHNHNIVDESKTSLKEIEDFVKKEYKATSGKSLSLTKEGELEMDVFKLNNKRISGHAYQRYKVKGLAPEEEGGTIDDPIRKATMDFIKKSKEATKPKNKKNKKDGFKIFEPAVLKAGIRK